MSRGVGEARNSPAHIGRRQRAQRPLDRQHLAQPGVAVHAVIAFAASTSARFNRSTSRASSPPRSPRPPQVVIVPLVDPGQALTASGPHPDPLRSHGRPVGPGRGAAAARGKTMPALAAAAAQPAGPRLQRHVTTSAGSAAASPP